jgi:transcription antitermination factor NusG
MELDEMKTQWQAMSVEIEKQKKLTDAIIIKMTQLNYKNKINKILLPEASASVICMAALCYLLVNLRHLTTWYLLVCGLIAVVVLFVTPILSISTILKMAAIDVSANDYKQTLAAWSKRKIQFVNGQKLSICLASLIMVVLPPVAFKLIAGMDLFKTGNLWYWYAICFPLFYWGANWVYKYYVKTVGDAENILKELE